MIYSSDKVAGGICFLASPHYQSIPLKLTANAVAGTPVTAAGAAALDGTNAIGLVMYDVDVSVNPNAAVLVAGVVDYVKAKANASITATAATLHTAIPAITFRSDCGVIS